jgi:hypothetical protein
MLLTSLAGTLLAAHAGLLLLEPLLNFDAAAWAARNISALNGVGVAWIVLGVLVQAAVSPDADKAKVEGEDAEEDEPEVPRRKKPAKPSGIKRYLPFGKAA